MTTTASIPNNAVWVGGAPVRRRSVKAKTVAGLRRRVVVVYDTDDDHCQVAGANAKHGVFGLLEEVHKADGTEWHNDADPTAEDELSVVKGKGAGLVGILASGQNVKRGDLLVTAANGRLQKASDIAIPAGGTAVTSTSANPALTGSVPPGGRIIGEAEMDVDATSEEKPIVFDSWI